jgi:two-component system, OmpR family, sensor histidine kinase MtrB
VRLRGVRARLILTIIGLVALTSIVLGAGAYAYVATSLRSQQLSAAREATNFDVAVLVAERLPGGVTRQNLASSNLLSAFALRGAAGTVVDFGDGDPVSSGLDVTGALGHVSPQLKSIVAAGDIGYERLVLDGRPLLVTGVRRPPDGPAFYFFFDASDVEDAIGQLGRALLVGGIALVAIAAVAGRSLARGLLLPVANAGAAAERIAAGDLSARLDALDEDEFGRWAASFNRMAVALEDKVAELEAAQGRERQFVADVSHELRTPLTALVAEVSLLADQIQALPEGSRRVAELIVTDVRRLRLLVDDLMEISRFDASAERVAAAEFEVGAFVRAVVAAHAPRATIGRAAGSAHTGVTVVADRRRLERILGNLLDNARVHGEGREVSVEIDLAPMGRSGTELVLAVADRGPGVPAADLGRLFDRFHKADPSRHQGGSGLGLAIAREHARLMGGSLMAANRPGGGLVFELRLPVARSLPPGDGPETRDGESAEGSDLRTETSP